MNWEIKIRNSVDLDNKIYPTSYYDVIWVDGRHFVQNSFNGLKSEIIQGTKEGKKYIERITTFREYQLSFIRDVQLAEFLAELKVHDFLQITDYKGEIITPEEWESKIDFPPNMNKDFRLITVIYRTDFVTKTNNNTNYVWSDANVNRRPVAQNVTISGDFESEGDILGNYTYWDADGDLEGTSLFRWQIADTSGGANKYLLANTTQNITLPVGIYGKYVRFGVMVKTVTGTQNTIYNYSDWYFINVGRT